MKASEKKVIELFAEQDTIFSIPVYQRDYNWEEKHCQLLFNDIMELTTKENTSHFIGSIVYIHDGVYGVGEKELNIIDGQQRITTLTLFFIALYQNLSNFNTRLSNKIHDQYLVNKYSEKEINLKLLLPEENLNILNNILKENKRALEEYQDRNLIKNFRYFEKTLGELSQDEVNNIMIGVEKLIYVEISLEKGKDDPQKIFESLNSTGLDLSQADLIRNYILMDLERNEQIKIYKEIWVPIEKNCRVSDGNKITTYVSDFIRDYLTLKTGKIPAKPRVFEEFKKFCISKNLELLEDLKEYSFCYAKILNPELEKDKILKKELKYLKLLSQTVINPFLIGLLKDYADLKITSKTLISILDILQNFIWRRYITGEPSNALNSLFQNMYLKVNKTDDWYKTVETILLNQTFPNDEELKVALKIKNVYKDKDKINYVFRKLENYYHNELIDFSNDKITIEHIFPQKPNKDWKNKYSSEELDKMIMLKDTIANLTLTGSNSNLSNKLFNLKRDEAIHGYRDSKLYLNKFLGTLDEWNLNNLEKRFEILFSDIKNVWKKPEL